MNPAAQRVKGSNTGNREGEQRGVGSLAHCLLCFTYFDSKLGWVEITPHYITVSLDSHSNYTTGWLCTMMTMIYTNTRIHLGFIMDMWERLTAGKVPRVW